MPEMIFTVRTYKIIFINYTQNPSYYNKIDITTPLHWYTITTSLTKKRPSLPNGFGNIVEIKNKNIRNRFNKIKIPLNLNNAHRAHNGRNHFINNG